MVIARPSRRATARCAAAPSAPRRNLRLFRALCPAADCFRRHLRPNLARRATSDAPLHAIVQPVRGGRRFAHPGRRITPSEAHPVQRGPWRPSTERCARRVDARAQGRGRMGSDGEQGGRTQTPGAVEPPGTGGGLALRVSAAALRRAQHLHQRSWTAALGCAPRGVTRARTRSRARAPLALCSRGGPGCGGRNGVGRVGQVDVLPQARRPAQLQGEELHRVRAKAGRTTLAGQQQNSAVNPIRGPRHSHPCSP